MSNSRAEIALICALLAGGLMVLYWILQVLWRVVETLSPYLLSTMVIGAFQIIMVFAGGIIALGISVSLFLWLFRWAIQRFAELEAKDAEILRELKRQSPSFLVATALIADCVLAITDKSFGNPAVIVCVTMVLIILFGIANHLFVRFDSSLAKVLGWALWVTALLIVPLAVLLSYRWTIGQLVAAILKQPPEFLIVYIVSLLIAVLCPVSLSGGRRNTINFTEKNPTNG